MTSKSIHVAANGNISFCCKIEYYSIVYMYVPYLLYPFICWWTCRLLQCLGCCKHCCYEYSASHIAQSVESYCNAGDLGSVPGLGRSPGEENGNPLQYSCLENPMDREAWLATFYGVARVRHDWVTKHMWILGYMGLFQLWFSQGICPVVKLLGHMVDLFLVF